jgi:REP element-mobilizing transposase RayT
MLLEKVGDLKCSEFKKGILKASSYILPMPRRKTSLQTGNFYHIYNRGNNHQIIFFERESYIYFLRLVKEHLITKAVDIVAYCLMPNHYHFGSSVPVMPNY